MRNKIVLGLIIAFALIVRVIGISKFPVGFTQDEASLGYDAYSLLTTGKDQWGVSWPLTFRSFGDFKMPLYSYLAIPSLALFGLNETSTRLPNAIAGTLAVLVTYLMVFELFKSSATVKSRTLATMAAFLLAISPWHISLSRGAFEANLTTLFIPLGIWAFLKGLEKPKWMVLSAVSFGLNLFSYHAARLFTPIIVILLSFFSLRGPEENLIKKIGLLLSRYKIFLLVFSLFFLVAFSTVLFGGAGKRGADILISNPTDKWMAVSQRRYEATLLGLPDKIARIYSNKVTYVVNLFSQNYSSYLSPSFLFFQGAGEWSYGMIPGRGVLYLFEILFVALSLIALIRKKEFYPLGFIFFWIILSPLPAAITKGPGYAANRLAVMLPAIEVLSAYGFYLFYRFIKEKLSRKISLFAVSFFVGIIFLSSFLSFGEDYLFHTPYKAADSMHYGMGEMVEYLSSVEGQYNEIRVSRTFSVPHISIAFYKKLNPRDYQNASKDWFIYQDKGFSYLDQMEGYRLGKYSFGSIDIPASRGRKGILLVGKPLEFPSALEIEKTIYFPDGTPAVVMVKSDSL
jgi:4-amino-4-deoxy-L-arabinose transferase-like glycosyltransferase